MHSAKCDVVIPGEEQLSSIPCREFVAFRESAVNTHSLFKLDWSCCQAFSPSSSPLPGSAISFFLSFFLSSQFTSVVRFQIPTFAGRAINSFSFSDVIFSLLLNQLCAKAHSQISPSGLSVFLRPANRAQQFGDSINLIYIERHK